MFKRFFSNLLILLLTTTLINNKFFPYPTQSAYFGFLLLSTLLISVTGFVLFRTNSIKSLSASLTVIVPLLIAVYLIAHSILVNHAFGMRYQYLIISCILCVSLQILNKYNYINIRLLLVAIGCLAVIESIICIAQYFTFIPSQNIYFKVTGTCVNPNVTAMFIAMALPTILTFKFSCKKVCFIVFGAVSLALISLLLLKCRTALVGAVITTAFTIQIKFNFLHLVSAKVKVYVRVILFIISLISVSFATIYFYSLKKASTQGRQLVWKVSTDMIPQKPLFGYGYGSFEKKYNIAQASYFNSGKGSAAEKGVAAPVKMAYNEYLENTVEGGIIGLLLFIFILGYLLLLPYKNSLLITNITTKIDDWDNIKIVSHVGIVSFAAMSLINFTITAIPAFSLFLFYAALLLAKQETLKSVNVNPKYLGIFFMIFGVFFTTGNGISAYSYRQLNIAAAFAKKRSYDRALQIMVQLPFNIKHNETYCNTLGQILTIKKDYKNALIVLEELKKIAPTPESFLQIGKCYYGLKQYDKAVEANRTAIAIQPSRFAPRHALLQIYLQQQDTVNINIMAMEIINLIPKIESAEVVKYKSEAVNALKQFKK